MDNKNRPLPNTSRKKSTSAGSRKPVLKQHAAVRKFLKGEMGQSFSDVLTRVNQRFSLDLSEKTAPADFVKYGLASKTSVKNGKVRVHSDKGVELLEDSPLEYFVHPENQKLSFNTAIAERQARDAAQKLRAEKEASLRRKNLGDSIQAHKIGASWFVVELATFGNETVFDALLGKNIGASNRFELTQLYGKGNVYAKQKRALTYQELRKFSLT